MGPSDLRDWVDLFGRNIDLTVLGLLALALIRRWHKELVNQLGRIEHAVNNLASRASLSRSPTDQWGDSPGGSDRPS